MLERVANRTLELNKLHLVDHSKYTKKEYINKFRDGFFDCLDECYGKLYGTVPLSREMQDELISQFMLILSKENLFIICDENDRVISFALAFPSISRAVQKSGGRLTIPAIFRILRAVKKHETLDLGLVAVRPEYQNAGINSAIINMLIDYMIAGGCKSCETNLNLEYNTAVMAQWKYFNSRHHKRRRSYLKNIEK